MVKSERKPIIKMIAGEYSILPPHRDEIQLNSFIPVGIAIIIVADVKYARLSISRPTLNI
jgi:hypothetical protein